jgi:hypothetical protein
LQLATIQKPILQHVCEFNITYLKICTRKLNSNASYARIFIIVHSSLFSLFGAVAFFCGFFFMDVLSGELANLKGTRFTELISEVIFNWSVIMCCLVEAVALIGLVGAWTCNRTMLGLYSIAHAIFLFMDVFFVMNAIVQSPMVVILSYSLIGLYTSVIACSIILINLSHKNQTERKLFKIECTMGADSVEE